MNCAKNKVRNGFVVMVILQTTVSLISKYNLLTRLIHIVLYITIMLIA